MTAKRRNWIIGLSLMAILVAAGLAIAASVVAAHIEPYARRQAVDYLSQRFDSDIQLQALHIHLPKTSPLQLLLTQGRGVSAGIDGEGLSMRWKGRAGGAADSVPLFVIRKFHCDVNLNSLLHPPVIVSQVTVDGMDIRIPPRGDSPRQHPRQTASVEAPPESTNPGVIIEKITILNAGLALQPRDPQRLPLEFDIRNLQLESVRAGAPMKYDATLVNAKPPGKIHATGDFGPWSAAEPGDTPLDGDYRFDDADLGVFAGIAGTLQSTGKFEGKLSAISAQGQAYVPDFRLKMTENPVPLTARFAVLVDGTNGNTILQPVTATLGSTNFTTSGGIVKHEANQPRAVSLTASMPNGNLRDVLRLAMKGAPFMQGRLTLNTRIDIPPLTGKVREKIELDGHFEVRDGRFLHSTIQSQIDALSKRASGQTGSTESDPAVSHMSGVFHLQNAVIRFEKLSFGVPGADIDLAGDYALDSDAVNFGGTLKLQATVSQLVTGWKRLILKPVDRFFEKDGAGTFLRIRVDGTSKAPRFGVNIAGHQLSAPLPKRR